MKTVSAAGARCDIPVTGDGRNGFAWRGVAVADPFAEDLYPLRVQLLASR